METRFVLMQSLRWIPEGRRVWWPKGGGWLFVLQGDGHVARKCITG